MPIRFRKSIQIGPFRVNLSKRGIGASVGVPGLRTGIRADGTRYTETSIPGTGISSRTEHRPAPSTNPSSGMGWGMILILATGVAIALVLLVK